MSQSPAVSIDKLPTFLRHNGHEVAAFLLGPRGLGGGGSGVIFWQMDPTEPRVLLVFHRREQRDQFVRQNRQLKELKTRYGSSISCTTYCRQTEEEVNDVDMRDVKVVDRGEIAGMDKREVKGAEPVLETPVTEINVGLSSSDTKSGETVGKEVKSASKEISRGKMKTEKLPKKSGRGRKPSKMEKTTINDIEAIDSTKSKSKPDLVKNKSVTPKLLCELQSKTQPDKTNETIRSNILIQLEDFIKDQTAEDTNNNNDNDSPDILARTVTDSWAGHVKILEDTYKSVVTESRARNPVDETLVAQSLSKQIRWEGEGGKLVLELTAKFLVNCSLNKGGCLEREVKMFMASNTCKLSAEEVLYIMRRNGLDLRVIADGYHANSSAAGFRNFLANKLPLSGQMLSDFVDIFFKFFQSREAVEFDGTNKASVVFRDSDRLKHTSGCRPSTDLATLLERARVEHLGKVEVGEIVTIKMVEEIGELKLMLMEANNKFVDQSLAALQDEGELKSLKMETPPKKKEVQLENKSLRGKNSDLERNNANLKENLMRLKAAEIKMKERIKQLETPTMEVELKDTEKICEITKVKQSQIYPCNQGVSLVKIRAFSPSGAVVRPVLVATNQQGQLPLDRAASVLGLSLVGQAEVRFRQSQGKSKWWQSVGVVGGMALPPPQGWGDREYVLFNSQGKGRILQLPNAGQRLLDALSTSDPLPSLRMVAPPPTLTVPPPTKTVTKVTPPINSNTTSPSKDTNTTLILHEISQTTPPTKTTPPTTIAQSPPKYLGQGWESNPQQQFRTKEHPMFPSTLAARGPRIRLSF